MMANKLVKVLPADEWSITIVDQYETHYYQPGLLFIPFGIYTCDEVRKPKRDFIPPRVEVLMAPIDRILPDEQRVKLADGRLLGYDYLIIATGARTTPEETEGLKGEGWNRNIFDFYTIEGACALGRFLRTWEGGRMVINIVEMPIKCPVAGLEFAFLADWWFTEQGLRDKVEIEYVTPLPGAVTRPPPAARLGAASLEPDLDELVLVVRLSDRSDGGRADPFLADEDDGLELVPQAAQIAFLFAFQLFHDSHRV